MSFQRGKNKNLSRSNSPQQQQQPASPAAARRSPARSVTAGPGLPKLAKQSGASLSLTEKEFAETGKQEALFDIGL